MDGYSADVVDKIASAMQLDFSVMEEHCIFITSNKENVAQGRPGDIFCILESDQKNYPLFMHFTKISCLLAWEIQKKHGILLHGALAEFHDKGLVFCGPGGTGKTTASHRLPSPWISHSDDATLLVRGIGGEFWAHPWPTWSLFLPKGEGGSWQVDKAVKLGAIYLLSQAQEDSIKNVGAGKAVAMLLESNKQASCIKQLITLEERRCFQLDQFNKLCTLVKEIPVQALGMSLHGSFWEIVEKELGVLGN